MRIKRPSRRTIIFLAVIGSSIVLLLSIVSALYITRGIFRNNILPGYFAWRHLESIQSNIDQQVAWINRTMAPYNLTLDEQIPAACKLSNAVILRTSVACYGEVSGRIEYASPRNEMNATLKEIDQRFSANGWEGGTEEPWGDGAYTNLAYYYSKEINGLGCYANILDEGPNILQVRLTCSQSFNFIGKPYY